eukprot:1139350-Pelagomonas_calceolata.AAC.2
MQAKCGALSTLKQARSLRVICKCGMSHLKSKLGVKRTTTNWAVLRECGHELLQLYWFSVLSKRYAYSNSEFTDDLRHKLRTVWRDVEGMNPWETYSKLATYQSIFAVPFDHNVRALARLPRQVHLDLSQHHDVVRNVSRFRLWAHTLKVETAAWDTRNSLSCVIALLIMKFRMKFMPSSS